MSPNGTLGAAAQPASAISQKLLEQNEDTIAAIVENLQLGRLDEALQHYLVLQGNLVALASELDNYPIEELDPFSDLDKFPDAFMRKDCLDDMLPFEERALPRPPILPPCVDCARHQLSSMECRVRQKHVAPSALLSDIEQQELLRNAQVVLARQRRLVRQDRDKRIYKKWSDHEKYTLCLAISNYGILSTAKIAAVFPSRTEKQVRNFISKSLRDERNIPSLDHLVQHPPPGYIPPPQLEHLFRPHKRPDRGTDESVPTTASGVGVVSDICSGSRGTECGGDAGVGGEEGILAPSSTAHSLTSSKSSHSLPDTMMMLMTMMPPALSSAPPHALTRRNDFATMVGLAMGMELMEISDGESVLPIGMGNAASGPHLASLGTDTSATTPHLAASSASAVVGMNSGALSVPSQAMARGAPLRSLPPSSNTALKPPLPSSSASLPSAAADKPGDAEERMTFSALQQRARQLTDKRHQAALLLEYYNQMAKWGKQPKPPLLVPGKNEYPMAIPPPASQLMPAPQSAPRPPVGPPTSSAVYSAEPSQPLPVGSRHSAVPAAASSRRPPPFARQGFARLLQQQQHQQLPIPSAFTSAPLAPHSMLQSSQLIGQEAHGAQIHTQPPSRHEMLERASHPNLPAMGDITGQAMLPVGDSIMSAVALPSRGHPASSSVLTLGGASQRPSDAAAASAAAQGRFGSFVLTAATDSSGPRSSAQPVIPMPAHSSHNAVASFASHSTATHVVVPPSSMVQPSVAATLAPPTSQPVDDSSLHPTTDKPPKAKKAATRKKSKKVGDDLHSSADLQYLDRLVSEGPGAEAQATTTAKKKRPSKRGKDDSAMAQSIKDASSSIFSPQAVRRRPLPASLLQVVRGEGSMDGTIFGTAASGDQELEGCLIDDIGDGLSFF